MVAKPTVDVNRADFDLHARRLHDVNHRMQGLRAYRGNIFAIVNG